MTFVLPFLGFLYHSGRKVNGRLNFDMVSDSVVAGSLGQQNGAIAAAFSLLKKSGGTS